MLTCDLCHRHMILETFFSILASDYCVKIFNYKKLLIKSLPMLFQTFGLAFATPPPRVERFSALIL